LAAARTSPKTSGISADLAEVRQLPQRLQELLGFNQATSYLGFVNGRHPRDWLMDSWPGREGH
jgi:hypothetical protein